MPTGRRCPTPDPAAWHNLGMNQGPFRNLDARKWFDRMHPQTLQIAVWLLYIDGAFAIINYLDRTDVYGFWRWYGGIGGILSPFACLSFIAGGFLMANGRKLGWWLALAAAFSPFLLRALLRIQYQQTMSIAWVITQNNLVSFVFEAALVALLLHPMSRSYADRWLR